MNFTFKQNFNNHIRYYLNFKQLQNFIILNKFIFICLIVALNLALLAKSSAQTTKDTQTICKNYAFAFEHNFIATRFYTNSELENNKVLDLPRGMEIAISKKINNYISFRLPLRAGFTKGTKDTVDRIFWGGDLQFCLKHDLSYTSWFFNLGIGTQRLNQKWDFGIPLMGGVHVKIDEGLALNIQGTYRLSVWNNTNIFQYGVGLIMKFGEIKPNTRNNHLPEKIFADSKSRLDSLIADSEAAEIGEVASEFSPISIINSSNIVITQQMKNQSIINILDNINFIKQTTKENLLETFDAEKQSQYIALSIQNITFEINKNKLGQVGFNILDSVVRYLNFYPAANLKIQGHTDNTGSNASNQILSIARAKICFDYFTNKGIESKRLLLIGFGEENPLFDNSTLLGRSKNRRVEFVSFLPDK